MKVSELWLREWVNPPVTGLQLASQLTMAGLEVDEIYPVAGVFQQVIVAQVLKTKPHPEADRLTLCDVDTGNGVVFVVCGATNVRPGLKVALALPGAQLPGDVLIKESMLRGQLSQGMLCSVTELGMDEASDGLMELASDATIGMTLRDYLQLDDQVFDINLTPNRADCFSILGVAREVAALYQQPLSSPPRLPHAPEINDVLAVTLPAGEACPRYTGRIIRSINPHAVTPIWMKERLRRGGIRVVHPVVDVTNYVMLELGQPMHAFDLSSITGSLAVRLAEQGESLVLLNGQDVTLDERVLVIADEHQPLALAGVMGGESSAVHAGTTDIFLESAFFNPVVVAGVARRYGLFSDSSQRFERGVDPYLQIRALERATALLQAIVGGQVGPVIEMTDNNALPPLATVLFHPSRVAQLTGVVIAEETMMSLLEQLGMTVTVQDTHWAVSVPTYRFDIALDVDLVEEIIRLYGYDNIPAASLSGAVASGKPNTSATLLTEMASFFSHRGYHETISYSFVDPDLQDALYPDAPAMRLINPISPELSVMRVGMWPGLLASAVYNAHRQQAVIRLFESGVVFDVVGEHCHERTVFAGLLTGTDGHLSWSETARSFDFYDLKGDLESLLQLWHVRDVRFVAAEHPALHPGQTARILVDGVAVGWLGVLHPRIAEDLDLVDEVVLFEVSLPLVRSDVRYQSISKYPQIRRDLSFLAPDEVAVADIEVCVRDVVSSSLLKAFDVFDVYRGDSIPSGKKSLAIALTLQDESRTLNDAEVNIVIDAILKKLDNDFGMVLRAEIPL